MLPSRFFLRQRSDDRREQYRFGQDCNDSIFMRNILSPVSICCEATASRSPDFSVFFPADAEASNSHTPGTPRVHGGATPAMIGLHDDPDRVLL